MARHPTTSRSPKAARSLSLPLPTSGEDLVGPGEVGEMAGVTRAAVANWRSRPTSGFPSPVMDTKAGPLYRRADVMAWLERRGTPSHSKPLGFESELWSLSDRLRGSVDASRYRHVILGLLFLRYATSDAARNSGLRVPDKATWSALMRTTAEAAVADAIEGAFDLLEKANPSFKGVLPRGYADGEIDNRRLRSILEVLDRVPLGSSGDPRDLLGRTYEYFLSRFASLEGKSGGEFFTPTCIVRLLVEMVEPLSGTVYDPCCGSGGMFVQSYRFIQAHGGGTSTLNLHGQELNASTWRLAHANLALHGLSAELGPRPADTLHQDLQPDLKADYILANPPFNMSDWGSETLAADPRFALGLPPASNANFAWLQHIVSHLAPGGRAGVVLANGSLTSDQQAELAIRKALVEAGLVDCMVALPPQLFYSTAIPVTLWLLSRREKSRRSKPDILMIDAHAGGKKVTRTHRALSDEEIADIAASYRAWRRTGKVPDAGTVGLVRSVPIAEVVEQGFSLSPARYFSTLTSDGGLPTYSDAAGELRDILERTHEIDRGLLAALQDVSRV